MLPKMSGMGLEQGSKTVMTSDASLISSRSQIDAKTFWVSMSSILDEEPPEGAWILIIVMYNTDEPPITRDPLEQSARGRLAGVQERPFSPDVKRFVLQRNTSITGEGKV